MVHDRAREQRLAEIVAVGRETRKPVSRGLWIAALIVGALGALGFAITMLATPAPASATPHLERRSSPGAGGAGSGLGIGLWIGAGVAIAIGIAIARQRATHSSRNSP